MIAEMLKQFAVLALGIAAYCVVFGIALFIVALIIMGIISLVWEIYLTIIDRINKKE